MRDIDDAFDFIRDFAIGVSGDALDVSEMLIDFVDGTSDPNDFVQFDPSGGDTIVKVDADGTVNGANFVDICVLQGVTVSNVDQAVADGNLVLA